MTSDIQGLHFTTDTLSLCNCMFEMVANKNKNRQTLSNILYPINYKTCLQLFNILLVLRFEFKLVVRNEQWFLKTEIWNLYLWSYFSIYYHYEYSFHKTLPHNALYIAFTQLFAPLRTILSITLRTTLLKCEKIEKQEEESKNYVLLIVCVKSKMTYAEIHLFKIQCI